MRLLFSFCIFISTFILTAQEIRNCATADYSVSLQKEHPRLKLTYLQQKSNGFLADSVYNEFRGIIIVPVVINILLADTNVITIEQINSQIDVLNQDFNGVNTDLNEVPDCFKNDINKKPFVVFKLYKIIKKLTRSQFVINIDDNVRRSRQTDPVKFSETGGIESTNPGRMLNLWVADIISKNAQNGQSETLFGYSTRPPVPLEFDGVVINYKYFGRTLGTSRDYQLGRTATHEVGHYFGLIHIWGDGHCLSDEVDDTPNQKTRNYGCHTGVVKDCNNTTNGCMYMNFMDYSSDACMHMFTLGQVHRMKQQIALYRTGLLVEPMTSFFEEEGFLENLSLIKGIRQIDDSIFITLDKLFVDDSTTIYIRHTGQNAWQKFASKDTVVQGTGLMPGKLYEIKIQNINNATIPLENLPSTFFIPDKKYFKTGQRLRLGDNQ